MAALFLFLSGCASVPQQNFTDGEPVEVEKKFFTSKLKQNGNEIHRGSFEKAMEENVGPDMLADSAYWYRAPAIAMLLGGPLLILHGLASASGDGSSNGYTILASGVGVTGLGALFLRLANIETEEAVRLYNESLDPNKPAPLPRDLMPLVEVSLPFSKIGLNF